MNATETPATVGLALIAKNEADNLPTLLASIVGAFDQIVLVDTGSTDDTVAIFEAWAQANGEFAHVVPFVWRDDFALARNFADAHLNTDWRVWADCDDELFNAKAIRGLVAQAPPEVQAFICDYDYAQHPETGACLCRLKRERIVRRGAGQWVGRVHEAQLVEGPTQFVSPDVVEWRHRKEVSTAEAAQRSNERNLKILRAWVKDEPENPRVLGYLGTENAVRGKHREAIKWYRRYLRLRTHWDEERAQIHRKLSASLLSLPEPDIDAAIKSAYEALDVMPSWPDSHITLAECYLRRGEPAKAMEWCRQALHHGQPDTLLIINPLDYTFLPRKLMAAALVESGQPDQGLEMAEQAMALFPDPTLAQAMRQWRTELKRHRTADTFAMCAEQLIAHDEQMKAWVLLNECVPHFACDHPRVVALRAQLYARIGWRSDGYQAHYDEGGSKPEDMHDTDELALHCAEITPRSHFLLEGLIDQVAA